MDDPGSRSSLCPVLNLKGGFVPSPMMDFPLGMRRVLCLKRNVIHIGMDFEKG